MAEWETVRRKRGRKGFRGGALPGKDSCCVHDVDRPAPEAPAGFAAAQAARASTLAKTAWFQRTVAEVVRAAPSVDRIACFGLGSIFESRNAQWQLAFLSLLVEALGGTRADVYDPILCPAEHAALEALGVAAGAALPDGDGGGGELDGRVLYYMPHCPMTLYAKVVRRHADSLDGLVIVGNSFSSYAARKIGADLDADIARVLDRVAEVPADPGKDDVLERPFNDTSIMTFPPAPSAPPPA